MRRLRLIAAAAVFTVVLVSVYVWVRGTDDPQSKVLDDSPSRSGWKTVEHGAVRVDVPFAWERSEPRDCELKFERWAPPDSPPCDLDEGVAFYTSANFDPADGPGVRRTTEHGTPGWAGYAYVGDFAVYASYGDRDLVRDILASAREAG